jgi:holin-like protein
MLNTLAALLVCQAVGEVLAFVVRLPVPGPVLGMALLLGFLLLRPTAIDALRPTSLDLLKHLSLLFVPAGVGVMLHVARLADEWLAVSVALVASTALAIAVTALVVQWTSRWFAPWDASAAPSGPSGSDPR